MLPIGDLKTFIARCNNKLNVSRVQYMIFLYQLPLAQEKPLCCLLLKFLSAQPTWTGLQIQASPVME